MRLRYVSGARELIEENEAYILDYQKDKKIDIFSFFTTTQPIYIEIGMGKGQFIHTLAKSHPNINFIGIERFDSVIVRALEKVLEEPLDNLLLLRADALDLLEIFTPHSISRIYLNFSDPWPKDRHQKRRLTNKRFLAMYQSIMLPLGEIRFKTDNRRLFDYSVEEVSKYPMDIKDITYDLHADCNQDNIMTEFEEKFSKQGNKIYQLITTFKEER